MCGLVGMTTNRLTVPEIKRLQFAAQISSLRGDQSTGTVWVDKDDVWRTHKKVGHPFDVVRTRQWNEMCNDAAIRVILMHTRFATKGAITIDNAHPFVCDGVVGMHNGTIHSGIPETYKRDVDSHGLFEFIAAKGHLEALKAVKYGAYALQWLQWHGEAEELKIHIIRNDERPLHYVDGAGFRLWMSDDDHLKFVMEATKTNGKIEKFKPYHLYTITINSLGIPTWSIEDLTDDLKKSVHYTGQSGRFFRGGYGGYYNDYYDDEERWGKSDNVSKQETAKKDGEGGSVVPFVQDSTKHSVQKQTKNGGETTWYNTYENVLVSPKRYKELKSRGCAWCKDDEVKDYDESFISAEDWVCPRCLHENGQYLGEAAMEFQREHIKPQKFHFSQFQQFKCVES